MKTVSYNSELLKATATFIDVFNDISIERSQGKTIKVKALYGQRSRIFKALENPDKSALQPPIITVARKGISRDTTRVADVNNYLIMAPDGVINYDLYPPNPIDIKFEVSILTKYQGDMDRILSNFIPFSNQSFFVKTENPKIKGEYINHEIIWDGEISEDDQSDIAFEKIDLRSATTTFTFKTWIWAGTGSITDSDKVIKTINMTPNLCALGVQQMLVKNAMATASELSAVSGFMLDDQTYYGDIYSLGHWYAVPTEVDFADFENSIALGRIEPYSYDNLAISGLSGYVHDLGLNLTEGDSFVLNGTEKYFVDNEGGIVIYTDALPVSANTMSAACNPTIG